MQAFNVVIIQFQYFFHRAFHQGSAIIMPVPPQQAFWILQQFPGLQSIAT
jgi:hypothetical protein